MYDIWKLIFQQLAWIWCSTFSECIYLSIYIIICLTFGDILDLAKATFHQIKYLAKCNTFAVFTLFKWSQIWPAIFLNQLHVPSSSSCWILFCLSVRIDNIWPFLKHIMILIWKVDGHKNYTVSQYIVLIIVMMWFRAGLCHFKASKWNRLISSKSITDGKSIQIKTIDYTQ